MLFIYWINKILSRNIFSGILVAILILSRVSGVYADVLFDSTSNPVFNSDLVTKGVTLNASFSTNDRPVNLKELTLLWRRLKNEEGLISIHLLADNHAAPGMSLDMLAEVNAQTLPVGEQFLTIPIKIQKTLNANSRYWIQIRATDDSGSMTYSRKHEGFGVKSEYYLNMYGLHRNDETGPYIFKIEGVPQ